MKRFALAALALAACAPTAPQPTVNVSRASGQSTCSEIIAPSRYPVTVLSGSEFPAGMSVGTEYGIYPGSTVYAEINGQRWSGEDLIWITPDLKAALMSGGTLNISWSAWPWGGREEQAVSLADYKGQCL